MYGCYQNVTPTKYFLAIGHLPQGRRAAATEVILENTLTLFNHHIAGTDTATSYQVLGVNLQQNEWKSQFYRFINGVPYHVPGYDREGEVKETDFKAEVQYVLTCNVDVFIPSKYCTISRPNFHRLTTIVMGL